MDSRERYTTLRRPKLTFAWRTSSIALMSSRRAVRSSEVGREMVLWAASTILEEILIALERANASFEKGSLRIETGGNG